MQSLPCHGFYFICTCGYLSQRFCGEHFTSLARIVNGRESRQLLSIASCQVL